MNEFIIGLFVGLAVGAIVGMFSIALLTVSKNNELEGEVYEKDNE